MPKKVPLVKINLDLLKPQSESQKAILKLFKWVLSSGRFLVITVEIIVLAAFLLRFKLDSELSFTKEAIEQQVPFIESLSGDETLIRQTQFQLSTIKSVRKDTPDYSLIIKKISSKTPSTIVLRTIQIQKDSGKSNVKIKGSASDNIAILSLMAGLKADGGFTDLNLDDVSLEGNTVNFTVTFGVPSAGGKT